MHRTSLLVCLVLPSLVFAHEGEAEDADAGVSERRVTTVRGTRPSRSAGETVIARDVIDAAPRTGATDLLRLVPGLVASQHSGEGKAQQLFLRGFDAVHGQDVELNVAGLPVNEVSHVHALGYADLNWLIPATVREVKVTEGSTRAWQGDFAVAGTVRYELGLEEEGLTLAAGYGRFNRSRLFAGFRPAGSEQTFAAIEYVAGDGFGASRAFSRVSALGQVAFSFDRIKVRAVAGTYGTTFDSPGVVRDALYTAGQVSFFQPFGEHQGGSSSRHQLLLGVELPHDDGKTGLELYGVLNQLELRNNFTGYLGNARGDGLDQSQRSDTEGLRLTHTRHLHLAEQVLLLDLGVGMRRDGVTQRQRGYDEVDGTLRPVQLAGAATNFREGADATFTQVMGSLWGELSWSPERWRFMLGGRLDVLMVQLQDPNAFQGLGDSRTSLGPHFGLKAGVERALGEHLRLFVAYGDGFRTPQARQLSDGERAPFVDVHGGELGLKLELDRLALNVLGFASYVANDFFFDHTVGTTSFVGTTLRGGGQVGVTARPIDDFVVSANVTAAQARLLAKDALLPYFAPLVGRLDGSWSHTFSLSGVSVTPLLGVGATLIGPRPLPYDEFSRPVFLLDAKVAVRVWHVELSMDLQNALDARWRDGEFVYASQWDQSGLSTRLPVRQFTAGTPRTVFFNLEVHL